MNSYGLTPVHGSHTTVKFPELLLSKLSSASDGKHSCQQLLVNARMWVGSHPQAGDFMRLKGIWEIGAPFSKAGIFRRLWSLDSGV